MLPVAAWLDYYRCPIAATAFLQLVRDIKRMKDEG